MFEDTTFGGTMTAGTSVKMRALMLANAEALQAGADEQLPALPSPLEQSIASLRQEVHNHIEVRHRHPAQT